MSMELEQPKDEYTPSNSDTEAVRDVYNEFVVMRNVMNQKYPEFNNRTLVEFLNDSQKRANSYVPSKSEQGKDDWQANVFTPTTRNKIKTLLASTAKDVPSISCTAFNETSELSHTRAEIMKTLVDNSFVMYDNPEIVIFEDGWNTATNGTVIKHDGWLKIKNKVKLIKEFDPITMKSEIEEKEVIVEDRAIERNVPVQNFYIKNPYIRGIQKQPAIAEIAYYDKESFDYEFGQLPNAKFVQTRAQLMGNHENQTFFFDQWSTRMSGTREKMYEVIRYYTKNRDIYRVIANGVLLVDSPLLWGKRRKKYPYSDTIFELFANSSFFWGNSLPNILMAEQDVENAFTNSLTDKTFRSMVPPMLIGINNKDALDLEDEYVTGDTKIYVDDVNNVKPLPIAQVNESEIKMLSITKQGMDRDSSDHVQGGASGSGSTAREIVIANERAEEIKGLFFKFMKDLWLQKYRLRTLNILMNYGLPLVTKQVGEEGAEVFAEQFKTFHAQNAELGNGAKGTMTFEVRKDQQSLSTPAELDVREEMSRLQGKQTEIVQITSDFLDDHEYEWRMETESLYQKSKALKMALVEDKMKGVVAYFPEIFMANKDKFFKTYMEGYGDDPQKYTEGVQMQPMGGLPMEQGSQPAQMTPSLPNLAGANV